MNGPKIENTGDSRLAENIQHFCRTLRRAGLSLGPGAVIDAMAAVSRTGLRRGDDFFFALRAVLVRNPSEFRLFDQAFHVYFRDSRLLDRLLSMLSRDEPQLGKEAGGNLPVGRIADLLRVISTEDADDAGRVCDGSALYSPMEILRRKDFEHMSIAEMTDARRLLRELPRPARDVRTRRFRPGSGGDRYDLRRSMKLMLQSDGQPVQLARRRQRKRPQALVLLCDISGSMSRYSSMFLHYAHALATQGGSVHVFVFGTRLTNISRWLRDRNTEKVFSRISTEVPDWDGGTRIADCLKEFNRHWARRVLSGNATVILLCDGLERDSQAQLSFQMERLKRSCGELIWMNPMLRYEAFEAKASGIRAMLPYADRFIAAHNIESISELACMLVADAPPRFAPRVA